MLNGRFSELPKSFELVVVEDTLGGIRSARAAGEILQRGRFRCECPRIWANLGDSGKGGGFQKSRGAAF
jgi:hypothetical protein